MPVKQSLNSTLTMIVNSPRKMIVHSPIKLRSPLKLRKPSVYAKMDDIGASLFDDWSNSSTFEVSDLSEPKKQDEAHQQQPQHQKHVQFAESQNKCFKSESITDEDVEIRWYSGRDVKTFRMDAKIMSTDIIESQKKAGSPEALYKDMLQQTFECCEECGICEVTDDDDEDDVTGIQLLSSKEEKQLRRRVQESVVDRLGLDRMTVHKIALDRFQRRKELVNVVTGIQQESAFQESFSDMKRSLTLRFSSRESERQAQRIRQACQDISRPSRLFARQMGKALAAHASK